MPDKVIIIAVFVHFNRFIDLKINFHTNPYNLGPLCCCDSGRPVVDVLILTVASTVEPGKFNYDL